MISMTMTISIDAKMVLLKNSPYVSMDAMVFHLVSFHVQPITKTVSRTVHAWKTVPTVAHVPIGIAPFLQRLLQRLPLLPPQPLLLPPRLLQLPQLPRRLPPQQQLPLLQLLQLHLILFLFFTPIQVPMQKLP